MDELTWLNASYLERILRKSEKDETIEVSEIIVKPATAKGDNYGSDLYRVSIMFSRFLDGKKSSELKSVLVKVVPQNGCWTDEDPIDGYFLVEMSMMQETLPRMTQILQDELNGISLAARCFHVQPEKPIHLIFEDLAPKGFLMADRQAGLDLDHCLLVIRNIAAFHASSAALLEKDPEAAANYQTGLYCKNQSPSMLTFFTGGTKNLGEEIVKWPELNPRISEKILNLSNVIYKKTCEVLVCSENEFKVINHGDVWTNNFLFRYDKQGKPIEQAFVDFQLSFYGTPAMDLHLFLISSPSEEVRLHHTDTILRKYHTTLAEIMAKLGCVTETPSFEDLLEIMRKRTLFQVLIASAVLPRFLVDRSEAKEMNEVLTPDGKYENPAYQGKLYRKIMTRLLPVYDSMGLLDP